MIEAGLKQVRLVYPEAILYGYKYLTQYGYTKSKPSIKSCQFFHSSSEIIDILTCLEKDSSKIVCPSIIAFLGWLSQHPHLENKTLIQQQLKKLGINDQTV